MPTYYSVGRSSADKPSNEHFQLHIHSSYEIYMFLEGDSKYIVEENVYSLEPGDVIIIRKNMLHRVYHNSDARYSRIVFNIDPEFFEVCGCKEYEKQFTSPRPGTGNKIDAEIVRKSGLYDIFVRLEKYSDSFKNIYTPVVRSLLVEMLYIIDSIDSFSKGDTGDARLKSIISYINLNFADDITLHDIEKKFFISKYHLCHIFPRATGLTVHQYITNKRLAMADDLIKNGTSISEAAEKSGFNSYSSFYRAYVAEFKRPPSR